ncbi:E3 ubiquitin-protein ligase ZNF598 [Ischnura elegans]|uniref:E3 ubiquitin-protein ligase ZNF598 n=1 Tax=Ischnura elegans TaxID=197161 RepID=UPI001ED8BFB2|nr:E3 ubiquitin-protein ligase ZNF598 [Ischnura elegans]
MTSTERIENSENTCVVCFKVVEIFSIGECDHPVCYECSTRMRVLCLQVECPICRQEMPTVIFTEEVRPFRSIKDKPYLMDKKYKICFENADIQKAFNKLLLHVCNRCHTKPSFRTFSSLHDHMKREHELFYCNLCVDNLKIFSAERRCYTRQELAQHRRKGDTDDRSHRGHPLCQFCDQRYMDNDELFRHLRRDHFFCHFCDADGLHQYYSSYECLREHYRAEHYLCEEENCVEEKFTSVFRTDIDLKAHKAQVHGRLLSKAAAKQARTLEVQFTLAPRAGGDPSGYNSRRGSYRGGRGRHALRDEMLGAVGGFDAPDGDEGVPEEENIRDFYQNQQQITLNMDSTQEFPTLSGGPSRKGAASSDSSSSNGFAVRSTRSVPAQRNQFTGRPKAPLAITDENFPALDGTPSPAVNTLHLSVNSHDSSKGVGKGGFNQISAAAASAPHRNLSIQVNHSQNSGVVCVSSSSRSNPSGRGPQVSNAKSLSSQDFPALGGSKGGQRNAVRNRPPSSSTRDSVELSARFASSCRTSHKKDSGDSVTSNIPASSRSDTAAEENKQKKKASKGENSSHKVEPSLQNGSARSVDKSNSKRMNLSSNSTSSSQSSAVPVGYNLVDSGTGENVINGSVKSADKIRTGVGTTGEHHPPPPPPGFTPTPPGFTSKAPPPGFTSSSSAPSLMQVPIDKEGWRNGFRGGHIGTFLSPPEFDARNVALVSKVGSVLRESGTSSLDEFRQLSVRFRKGSLSAHAYYHHCLSNMGASNFDSIFPELLVLLPDIEKQQELWKVHEEDALPQHHGWKRWGLECCNSCGQVLSVKDLEFHLKSHALEANFPALPSSGNASFPSLPGFSSVATSTR